MRDREHVTQKAQGATDVRSTQGTLLASCCVLSPLGCPHWPGWVPPQSAAPPPPLRSLQPSRHSRSTGTNTVSSAPLAEPRHMQPQDRQPRAAAPSATWAAMLPLPLPHSHSLSHSHSPTHTLTPTFILSLSPTRTLYPSPSPRPQTTP